MLLGVLAGSGFFLLLYLLSKGAWIGGGDVRLGLFMGVILGWPKILVALLFAYIIGAAVSLGLILLKKKTLKSETFSLISRALESALVTERSGAPLSPLGFAISMAS